MGQKDSLSRDRIDYFSPSKSGQVENLFLLFFPSKKQKVFFEVKAKAVKEVVVLVIVVTAALEIVVVTINNDKCNT